MKKIISFFLKPFRYAICFSLLLISFSAYVLLDVFVIPKAVYIMDPPLINNVPEETSDETDVGTVIEPVITDMSYYDGNIDLKIEKFDENGVIFYVADLKLSSAKYLKTAFAKGAYGRNINEKTSVIAEENDALFAINGDYCGFRDDGVIMRNGVLLRENPRTYGRMGMMIDEDGNMLLLDETKITENALIENNIVQCFSFGPTLVVDGEINISKTGISKSVNPRTGIGQIEPLHYIFIVADGRTKDSKGMDFPEFAEEFYKRGCQTAYNLDGGGSATMWFNGNVINSPTDGRYKGEREISDIIYVRK